MDAPAVAEHAERIVSAIALRSEQDPGMSLDEIQRLLILRVREEAAGLGIGPRALMGAVWRAWERRDRPPLLGAGETQRVIESLAARGLLTVTERGVFWSGRAEDLASMELTHEERLFVEAVLRVAARYTPNAPGGASS